MALVLLTGGTSRAAPSHLVQIYLDPGNAPPVHRGFERSGGRLDEPYAEVYAPLYHESAPGIVVSGHDLAGGRARADRGVLGVGARVEQQAQGGTLRFFSRDSEVRAYAEYVLDDVVIRPVGPGPHPTFTNPVFRIPLRGFLPDPTGQGHIYDTFLSTSFPDETFAGAGTELRLSVRLRNESNSFFQTAGAQARIALQTRYASGSTVYRIFGGFVGHEQALQGQIPFVAEIPFLGAPVGEALELTVSIQVQSSSGYGFPENGGVWEGGAEAYLDSDAPAAALTPVAVLAPGLTLDSEDGGIVDNTWTLPEPASAAGFWTSLASLLALARVARRR